MAAASRPATHGTHYLLPWAVDRVLSFVPVEPGELVLDLGAGAGALTVPLARRGARVIAVEQYPRAVAELRRRTATLDVAVVRSDIRDTRWPRRPFRVVASPPYELSTWLIRQLTERGPATLRTSYLLLQRGFVRRLLENSPPARRDRGVRFEDVLHLPAAAFSPPPRVGASLLRVRRGPDRSR